MIPSNSGQTNRASRLAFAACDMLRPLVILLSLAVAACAHAPVDYEAVTNTDCVRAAARSGYDVPPTPTTSSLMLDAPKVMWEKDWAETADRPAIHCFVYGREITTLTADGRDIRPRKDVVGFLASLVKQ